MERQEAEGRFGRSIYDPSPTPEAGVLLGIVRIPDWEASRCSQTHLEHRPDRAMRVDDAAFDDVEKELELRFHPL